jgi:hypothetical protein
MTRDDIIRMAREAGSIDSEDVIETVYAAFSAAERARIIKMLREMHDNVKPMHNYYAYAANCIEAMEEPCS